MDTNLEGCGAGLAMTPCSFSRATVTKYHKLGAIKKRNVLSPSSGDQETKIQVWAGLAPWEALRGNAFHASCPASGRFLAIGVLLGWQKHHPRL